MTKHPPIIKIPGQPDPPKVHSEDSVVELSNIIQQQQNKINRLYYLMKELEADVKRAKDRSRRATCIAARMAAKAKDAEDTFDGLMRQAHKNYNERLQEQRAEDGADQQKEIDELTRQTIMLGRIVTLLWDHLKQHVGCDMDRFMLSEHWMNPDGRVPHIHEIEPGVVVEILNENEAPLANDAVMHTTVCRIM